MKSIRIFSVQEKQELANQVFAGVSLDQVDFSGADLRGTRFNSVSLRGSDFRGADLRGAELIDCDLRDACLREVQLGDNRFDGSCFTGAIGLSVDQTRYVVCQGGTFLATGTKPAGRE